MENSPSLTSEEIISQLRYLAKGLFYQSESDFPVEVVSYKQIMSEPITNEKICNLIGQASAMPVEEVGIASFFQKLVLPDFVDAINDNAVNQVSELQSACVQHLHQVKVFRLGRRTLTILLLGNIPAGVLVELKTTAIET